MSVKLNELLEVLPPNVEAAHRRIASVVQETPLIRSAFYSQITGGNVYLKCENLQTTGSFKLRGAANKYLLIPEMQRETVVAASTGNHGKAVAYVADQFGTKCRIFAPNTTQENKLSAIRQLGAEIELVGDDCLQSELAARKYALDHSSVYIPPYNDVEVIAGQGTIGVELARRLDNIDVVLGSVGGGGMLGGVAAFVSSCYRACEFVACSPVNSCVLIQSMEAGEEVLDLPSRETLSDGTAGGVESGAMTLGLCQSLVNRNVLVTENEIANALKQFVDVHGMLIEGAAAVALASLLKEPKAYQDKDVVVILCGGNISFEKLVSVARWVTA